jgi:hypothetical protein
VPKPKTFGGGRTTRSAKSNVVQAFDKRSVKEFELEAVERYFRVRFLGER